MTLEEAIEILQNKDPNVIDLHLAFARIDQAKEVVALAVASGDLIPAQCCLCGKTDLSVNEGDGGPECQLEDGRWTCNRDCFEKASGGLIPKADADLAVALAYQRACQVCERMAQGPFPSLDAMHYRSSAFLAAKVVILALAPADALAEVASLRARIIELEKSKNP